MNSNRKLAAVILAAGASRRMGRSKALLEYRGETFLGRLVRLFAPYCDPVLVVLPPSGLTCPRGVTCVVNPAPERGMLTSLQCGLRAVPASVEGVFFTPVDLPTIAPETVSALASAPASPVVIPRNAGRRGHPVLLSRDLIPEVLALPVTAQARDVVEAHAAEVRYVDVDDPGILADIDEPADYERLTSEASR